MTFQTNIDICDKYLVCYNEKNKNINLGDAIQTIALKQFLERNDIFIVGFIDRSSMRENMIINGWHRDPAEKLPKKAFFISLHTDIDHLKDINNTCMVGCRDIYTLNCAKSLGLNAILSGCVTCTFDVYTGPRKGIIRKFHGEKEIPFNLPFSIQLQYAENLLKLLKTAELVYTDRLHIALPCIAFGTPVILTPRHYQLERYSIFDIPPYPGHGKKVTLHSGVRDYLFNQFKHAFDLLAKETYLLKDL